MLVADAEGENSTTGCGVTWLVKKGGMSSVSWLMLVMLVAIAEEEDVTAGCGLSKERGHVFWLQYADCCC